MKIFSEISDNPTLKDNLINEVVVSSGLAKDKVSELFESFALVHNGDLQKINESFVDFLNPNTSTFDFTKFQEDIYNFATEISKVDITPDSRAQISENLISYIEKTCDAIVDVPRILEIICYILLLKNEKKFDKIANAIGFGSTTKKLFESDNINILKINVDATNNRKINKINATEDINFYGGLKNLLAKNNGRWGYNYHLDNAYKAIQEYLASEIELLSAYDSMVSVDNSFHEAFLKELLTAKQLNPMYRNISSLRTVISDIQTLIFDLMIVVKQHIKSFEYKASFVSRESLIDYYEAEKMLAYSIISSSYRSVLTQYGHEKETDGDLKIDEVFSGKIDSRLVINRDFVDVWQYPVNTKIALDALHIIKGCETEVSLPIRKILNRYVTKTTNLVVKFEKIIIQREQINKYKSY